MTQQSARTLIISIVGITLLGLFAYNGFFLALGAILR